MSPTRWFDENGDELFNENVNPNELEHICEVGGSFEEFSIGINFISDKLDREEITRLLGAEPTKSWNPGEPHRVGNTKKTRVTDFGNWYLTTKRDNIEINEKLMDLMINLTRDLNVWKYLTTKYQAWIDVAGYMENWNREFSLKPEVMKLLAERNLEIVFDIYYNGQEDDD